MPSTRTWEDPSEFREVYQFDFVRAPTQLTGTYNFTLDHKFDHTGEYSIPLTLPLVTNAD
ncbi:MAG TPA: hypothetical protein VMP03_16005 [Methylomirabilota bacterium]|nr:hypothetical protein [Methylomirabilota bacterium]